MTCALAEGVGFEPTVPCGTPVFKTGGFNRSPTPPECSETWKSYDLAENGIMGTNSARFCNVLLLIVTRCGGFN